MKPRNPERSALGDEFDRTMRSLHGVPDVVSTKATTIRTLTPVAENSHVALPPEVADCIARQRDALGTKSRKRAAKQEAARRKAAGIKPGFLKVKPTDPEEGVA